MKIVPHQRPEPLPATVEEFKARRLVPFTKPFLPAIEAYVIKLYPDPLFRRLSEAAFPEDALEGSLPADNFARAMMLREAAREADDDQVGSADLAKISRTIGAVMMLKYGFSRRKRRLEELERMAQAKPGDFQTE
jgi:hypothetical protein